ncbi:fumarylacetoacetate (FAA) hydrolase family protein [Halomonas elongata]|uniref:Fumarylacetoacetate (FAA) hydrolase family protein n=1 Tax=Halomonas elongata TaxID=2746 RepID=A0A1B8P1M3_HALEL|nr:fumarylacetoacetate (FAA) hydrolase family protein [Halomonas elongata]
MSQDNRLPDDQHQALLVGRVWRDTPEGPALVIVRDGQVIDVSGSVGNMADLLDRDDAARWAASVTGPVLCDVTTLLDNSERSPQLAPHLLAPCDIQAIKACGVTFAVSLLERVIEEQASGDPGRAAELRDELQRLIGGDLSRITPGSDEAMALRDELKARGAWSQYMEVGIGPDAEVFTKAQPLSSVGFGAWVGLHPASHWNNPEPEIVLAVNAAGVPIGATLGNDVNLRDIEGRSALLLGKAKDNNASCAIGPSFACSTSTSPWTTCAAPWSRCASTAKTTASGSRTRATCARSAAHRRNWSVRPSAPITNTRMASCCFSAPCSRRSRIGTDQVRDSPTIRATS